MPYLPKSKTACFAALAVLNVALFVSSPASAQLQDQTQTYTPNQAYDDYPEQKNAEYVDLRDYLPPVQQQGELRFITGGIGEYERDALEKVKPQYNLHIMSADMDGAFAGDTHLVIADADGDIVLDADVGPIFYGLLPRGRYVVTASSEGQMKKQTINIGAKKATRLHFSWKLSQ